jgi:hypothetical protein
MHLFIGNPRWRPLNRIKQSQSPRNEL